MKGIFLTLADGSRIPVVAIGVFNLYFESRVLILEDCSYVPNVCRNLISTTYLGKHGYYVILKDNVVIKKDKMFICSDNIVDGLYILTPNKHELYNSELDNKSHVDGSTQGQSKRTPLSSRTSETLHSYIE